MKPGTYRVNFIVDLKDCKTEEDANRAVAWMVGQAIEDGDFPEVDFELVEELDLEYNTEEDELKELEF